MLSEDIITIPTSQTASPIKYGVDINLDHLPVTVTKDGITYDVEDYINMLIDKKLNAEVESNNPCYDCQNDFDCHNCKYEYLQA